MPDRPGMAGSGLDPVADRAARQRALDPHQSFIVQAPAGSGEYYAWPMLCCVSSDSYLPRNSGGDGDER